MTKIKKIMLSFVSLILIFSGSYMIFQQTHQQKLSTWQQIQQRQTVIIGLDDSFVPMGFTKQNGKISGYDVDLAQAVFKQYHLKVKFQPIDWSMSITELRNGTIDLLWNGLTINPRRQQKIDFSQPYLANQQVLIVKKSQQITSPQQMAGKTLGVQTGSAGSFALEQKPQVLKQYIKDQTPVSYDTFTNAFLDLNANRIQGLLGDNVYAEYYLKHQAHPENYLVLPLAFSTEYYGVGVKKGEQTLVTKVNAGLQQLAANGELAKINQKWFGNTVSSPLLANN